MIDIKLVRDDVEDLIKKLNTRGKDFSYLREVKEKDVKRRTLLVEVEDLKKERNDKSKLIGELKREKKDASDIMERVSLIKTLIEDLDKQVISIDEEIKWALLNTPNILDATVPLGKDETENVEIKKYLKPTIFDFSPKEHFEIGEKLNILDFERASKVTGSRFAILKGDAALLEIALIMFMIDHHSKSGYKAVIPPYIVSKDSMLATGQLPKFSDDAFKLANGNGEWYLNPTAEVPTINMHRDEILSIEELPIKYVSYTTAFRSEAGSAGRDTRGLIRMHQFNKVELIKFSTPEESYNELEKMLLDSESILQELKLPYRVVSLCSGDMGFGMAKTYDIEVWLPGQNTYREIGSISNAADYQARRGNIRFRRDKDSKLEFIHTLNGSGLAVGRTMVAILENYQQKDGSVKIPDALIPYMKKEYIR